MTGIRNLTALLSEMRPELRDGTYVYCTVSGSDIGGRLVLQPLAVFIEEEGLTLILDRDTAVATGFDAGAPMRCITLMVHSSLEAVGLTAAVATELTRHGISANVVAAYYHDHIFVPESDAESALAALKGLAQSARSGRLPEV